MDETDIHSEPESELNHLREQFEGLRQVVISALVLMIVVSGAFNLYLLRQVKYTRIDLAAIRPQAEKIVETYTKTNAPLMTEFLKRLTDYGRDHPDFQPLLVRYHVLQPSGSTDAAPTSVVHPAPATEPAPAPAPK